MCNTNPAGSATLADRLLDGIVRLQEIVARAVRQRREPGGAVQLTLKWIRHGLTFGSFGYLLALLVFLCLLEWAGERIWPLWLFLYVPPQIVLLPLAVFVPVCALFHPKLCFVHAATAAVVLLGYMDPEWSRRPEARGRTVTVLTNNIGQKQGRLTPFVELENPDIIALQEAKSRGPGYAKQYSGFSVAYHGEFVLASRFPVVASGFVQDVKWGKRVVAAWFELDFEGTPIVVYNIHFPTPRRELSRLRGLGFAAEVLHWLRGEGDRKGSALAALKLRLETARRFAEFVGAEKRPVIVLGDFNTPNHGCIYRFFTGRFTAAFERSGRGYGFTFPGTTRNPLTLFGPWLRLDHVFSSRHWRPIYSRVEPRRKAQHRAMVARFEFLADGQE